MNHPAISIISPVYNMEKYLSTSIQSVLQQNFDDFELLLIDDGSTDTSGSICDHYAAQDTRIRVFHTENRGVGAARQKGVSEARGLYSIHLDPDDWIEPEMLCAMYEEIIRQGCDILLSDYYLDFPGTPPRRVVQKPSSLAPRGIISELLRGDLLGGVCNKLVRHSLYREEGIRFPSNLSYAEDLWTLIQILLTVPKVGYLSKAFYHYTQNETSITHTFTRKIFEQRFLFIQKITALPAPDPRWKKDIHYAELDVVCSLFFHSHGLYTRKECAEIYPECGSVVWTSRYSFGMKSILWSLLHGWDGLLHTLMKLKQSRHPAVHAKKR